MVFVDRPRERDKEKRHEILHASTPFCSFQLDNRAQHVKCASFVRSEDKNARSEVFVFDAPREKKKHHRSGSALRRPPKTRKLKPKTHRGAIVTTRWPRFTSSAGSAPSTSPRPPVFENGATSAATKTSVWGGPGAGAVIGAATALVDVDEIDALFDDGASLDAGSLVDALRAAAAAAGAVAVREDAAAAVIGRAVAAERMEEEEEARAIV